MPGKAEYREALNRALEQTGEQSPGWNVAFRKALDSRGLCLLNRHDFPEETGWAYPEGLPYMAPSPMPGPEGWSQDHVIVWKELVRYPPLVQTPRSPRPRIVCLCGSTRFREAYELANQQETLRGKIVLTCGVFSRDCSEEVKQKLDALHLAKIDLADEVLILNVGRHIGESTSREMWHAFRTHKALRFLEPVFFCPECGVVKADEDWCCAGCGRDCLTLDSSDVSELPSEHCARTGVQNCHACDNHECGDNLARKGSLPPFGAPTARDA